MPVLDFAYEVQGRLERVSALFPLGRADLTGVLSDVLGSTYFAQQLTCIAADTIVMDFVRLDVALGANDKGTAQCHTLFFDQYLEVSGELMGGVSEHGVLYLANGRRAVMPCFVGEVGICGNRENLNAQLLELIVMLGQVF